METINQQDFFKELVFNVEKPMIKVILETDYTKEIRIALAGKVEMRKHQAPFPIVVHVLKGEMNFGVQEDVHLMSEGSIIALDANVPHNLIATQDCVVRLTLLKQDTLDRINKVIG